MPPSTGNELLFRTRIVACVVVTTIASAHDCVALCSQPMVRFVVQPSVRHHLSTWPRAGSVLPFAPPAMRCSSLSSFSSSSSSPLSSASAYVTEGLTEDDLVDLDDPVRAGEGDILPEEGLQWPHCRVAVFAAGRPIPPRPFTVAPPDAVVVRLGNSGTGWGTGCHPSTQLCLELISKQLAPGDRFLDYGVGSSVLSCAALMLGAAHATGVDVEAEALVAAAANLRLNGFPPEEGRADLLHVREVSPGSLAPRLADFCVANILVGQLVRPSMVAVLATNLRAGGLLCLSGVRPEQCASLRAAYSAYYEWDDSLYAEAGGWGGAEDLDWGRWARLVGRRKSGLGDADIERLSELAVS